MNSDQFETGIPAPQGLYDFEQERDACGVGFPEVNRAIVEAVRYIQAQPAGSRLLGGRSVMGVLRWMLQLCLCAEQELARAGGHGPSMSERVRILLDKSPVPC